MLFGGIEKNSLIDYPGKLSCILFLSGCNFECPYCHNPNLARGGPAPSDNLTDATVYEFLQRRRGFLDGVVISGGEPTLHWDLLNLCEKLREMGYPVKLDTNGSRPETIKALLDRDLVDYIAMDIKTDPTLYPSFIRGDSRPDRILKSIRWIMASSKPYEFRTTCVKPLVQAPIIRKIAGIIEGAGLYVLQCFHAEKVLRPEFFQENGAGHSLDELLYLKSIAEPHVEKCIVR
jgi:pyruvate formate lyase activating enzyme